MKRALAAAAVVALTLGVAACGGDDDDDTGTSAAATTAAAAAPSAEETAAASEPADTAASEPADTAASDTADTAASDTAASAPEDTASSEPADTAAGGESVAAEKASKPYKVTLIQGIAGDAFYGSMACGAQAAATDLGVTVEVQGGQQWSPSVQVPLVNSVVATKPDAILIAVNDPKALQAPLQQAVDAGIKVVLVDTTLEDPSIAASEVTSDNIAAGAEALRVLAEQVGGKGSVFVLSTIPGVSTTDDRAKGFEDAIAEFPEMKSLGIEYDTSDSAEKSAAITSAKLAANPDLVGVFALNTFTGQGAATALKQAGKLGEVKLVGFDANPSGVQALEEGTAQAQVVLRPLDIGYQGVVQAVNSLDGRPVEKKVLTGAVIATKDNLQDPEVQKYLYKNSCD